VVLLAVFVVERRVVLAPLALRDALRDTRRGAPGTLNAGRGASVTSRRARRRVRRPALARLGSRTSAVTRSSARACCWFESRGRAHAPRQPRRVRRSASGGCHVACAFWVHASNQQQTLVSSHSGPRGTRVRNARVTHLYRTTLMAAHSRASLGRRLSPAGSAARALHRGLLGSRRASRD